ncbi:MAG: hypothetical protein ACLGIA_11525 [Actinomycetes bacterium]
MPVYILEGSASALLGHGTVTVSLAAPGIVDTPRLDVVGEGADTTRAIAPRPGLLVLPSLREHVLLRVSPPSRERAHGVHVFPDGTVVTISLSTGRDGDPAADRAVLNHVDVSGLPYKDLVSVTPTRDGVVVAALEAVAEDPLPPLASAARMVARSILGVERVPEDSAVEVLVAVDTSASIQPCRADGSLESALEVLTGVSQVMSRERSVRLALFGSRPTLFPVVPPAEVPASLLDSLQPAPTSYGLQGQLPELPGAGRCITYLLTNGPVSATPSGSATRKVHPVVLAPRSAWPLLARPDAAASFVPVPDRGEEARGLVAEPHTLHPLVGSLLRSCVPAGSPLAERLSR